MGELNDFFSLEEEFKLKGLAVNDSNDIPAYSEDVKLNHLSQLETTDRKYNQSPHRNSYKKESTLNDKNNAIVLRGNIDNSELDIEIEEMMEKQDGLWTCKI